MIDKTTYELLKQLHEFPCEWNTSELEYGRFEDRYRALYDHGNGLGNLYSKLKSLGYLEIPRNPNKVEILFTQKGFDAVKEYEDAIHKQNQKNLIEEENIRLQNEHLRFQNQLRYKENEIRDLTATNLKLQNKQLKNKIMYAILGGAIMVILSNWKDILVMLQILNK